ncbi:hypothetical protein [Tenacibaculum sp. IB213877]|uniref:hypothetical protein n=1 Tax=Tenacibaculum sp. IB213877 TaxID=3097351 RepID=UPI002A5ADB27|nr:hypothetical protein [Tenacibaculum sp. IB213877]MDY0781349.1 hypothetical protein [Tenacibaculum sp. IB213877]
MLKSNNLVSDTDSFLQTIPISFESNQLTSIKKLEVLYDKKGKIQFLSINDNVVKRSKPIIRKAFTVFLGYFLTIVSGIGLLLLPISAYYQIKDNKEHGTTIYVPNRLEGIKNFFKIFTKK